MRGRTMPFHPRAEKRETAEDRIQRIERARPRHHEEIGTLAAKRHQLVSDGARRGARVAHGQEAASEPVDLLRERRLEAGALPSVQALARTTPTRAARRAPPPPLPCRACHLLHRVERMLGDGERSDLALPPSRGLDRLAAKR